MAVWRSPEDFLAKDEEIKVFQGLIEPNDIA